MYLGQRNGLPLSKTGYGRIAATNALSDVYATGGEPKLALNNLCVPETMPDDAVCRIHLSHLNTCDTNVRMYIVVGVPNPLLHSTYPEQSISTAYVLSQTGCGEVSLQLIPCCVHSHKQTVQNTLLKALFMTKSCLISVLSDHQTAFSVSL